MSEPERAREDIWFPGRRPVHEAGWSAVIGISGARPGVKHVWCWESFVDIRFLKATNIASVPTGLHISLLGLTDRLLANGQTLLLIRAD